MVKIEPRWKKGESGNPQGGSRKATRRKELRRTVEAILRRAAVGETPEEGLGRALLAAAYNLSSTELTALLKDDDTPHLIKGLLVEATKDPAFSLNILRATQPPATLKAEATVVQAAAPPLPRTDKEVSEAHDRYLEYIRHLKPKA